MLKRFRSKTIMRVFVIVIVLCTALGIYRKTLNHILFQGILNADSEMVANAIKWGADVNAQRVSSLGARLFETNDTPLTMACGRGEITIVQQLLVHGANPNLPDSAFGATPLQCAFYDRKSNRFSIARLLLDYGAVPELEDRWLEETVLWDCMDTAYASAREDAYVVFCAVFDACSDKLTQSDMTQLIDYAERHYPRAAQYMKDSTQGLVEAAS